MKYSPLMYFSVEYCTSNCRIELTAESENFGQHFQDSCNMQPLHRQSKQQKLNWPS